MPTSTRNFCCLLLGALACCGAACHKFLDQKPATDLLVPTTLSDFQALLDNTSVFGLVPTLGEASADNYYLPDSFWYTLDTREHNAYIWAADIFGGVGGQQDWNVPYQQVFYANVVLQGLDSVANNPDSVAEWQALKGAALFFRAFAFYNVAQLFAPVFDSLDAPNDKLGIPLRLSPDVNLPSVRSTVQQTYDQVISDLLVAIGYLPAGPPNSYRNRPIKLAAQALLARVYLSMGNYALAGLYADSVLQVYPVLMDYNNLDTTLTRPFALLNPETLYQASFLGAALPAGGSSYTTVLQGGRFNPNTRIDTGLIASYDLQDLRLYLYYYYQPPDSSYLRGSYAGTIFPFGGLATDECYLIRAECAARAGNVAAAMTDINTLLTNRWITGTFTPYNVNVSQDTAVNIVLTERRKELPFRGLRWTDLRRLNEKGANLTLVRQLFGMTYTLTPNSNNYTLPLPPDVEAFTGMAQPQRN
jgi:hypothetical protein